MRNLAIVLFVGAQSIALATPPDPQAAAREIASQLAAGKFAAVYDRLDDTMKAALSPAQLEAVWKNAVATSGDFASVKQARAHHVVEQTCAFAKGDWNLKVSFDEKGQIDGMYLTPIAPKHENEVAVSIGELKLPGTILLPRGTGPFPLVVLVHGSGPQDGDETIGPNKPFLDLALGLAKRGVATLRYEKRTHARPAAFVAETHYTVEEEVLADARAAIALAQKSPHIDPARVFLLGHSLGGMLAPRIAKATKLAGVVILAGATRPLEDLIVEQMKDRGGMMVGFAEKSRDAIRDPKLKPTDTVELFGAKTPGSYWLDLRGYRPAEVAATLDVPMLVLQGDRDIQVRRADYDGWMKALSGHKNVKLKTYPTLTHLFMEGTGTVEDYAKPGHVADEVIAEIAEFVSAARKR